MRPLTALGVVCTVVILACAAVVISSAAPSNDYPVQLSLVNGDPNYPQLNDDNQSCYVGNWYAFGLNYSALPCEAAMAVEYGNATLEYWNGSAYVEYDGPISLDMAGGTVWFLIIYNEPGTYSETAYVEAV